MKRIIMILMCTLMLTACTPRNNGSNTESQPIQTDSQETVATQQTESETQSTESSTEPELTVFTVYTPNEAYDGFFTTEVQGDKLTALEALITAGVLTEDVKVNSIVWNDNNITIDFNSAFADLIHTQGSTGERMIMGCVVNTFLSANGAETMMITIDGQVLESGHVVYDFPMEMIE